MTATLPPSPGRTSGPDTAATDRRVDRRVGLPGTRAVVGGLLMAVAATGTFLAYANANQDHRVNVLIASRDLHPGEILAADDLAVVAVDVPAGVRGLFGAVDAAVGRQILSPVDEGEFLPASATLERSTEDQALEVSIALPGHRAGGRLLAGERVDVFSTWSGSVTELVAVDARVLEISGASNDGLAGSEQVIVRLAVADFDQVEALVHAQAAGDITMVRAALDAETPEVGREYRPMEGRATTTTAGS